VSRLVRLRDAVLDPLRAARRGDRLEGGVEPAAEAATLLVGMHVCLDPPQRATVIERPESDDALAVDDDERIAFDGLAAAHHDWIDVLLADMDGDARESLYHALGNLKRAIAT